MARLFSRVLWKCFEWVALGFLLCLPAFLLYWILSGLFRFGNEIVGWAAFHFFGKEAPAVGFLFLFAFLLCIGLLFDIPYVGQFLTRVFSPIPVIGALLQQKEIVSIIIGQWKSSGCGPIFISLYRDKALHPATITKVFLTDFGYLVIVGVASFPPQELYYWGDEVVWYGLSAPEVSAIHMTLGFSAKRSNLRGVLKRATIAELVERYHLYGKPSGNNLKENTSCQ